MSSFGDVLGFIWASWTGLLVSVFCGGLTIYGYFGCFCGFGFDFVSLRLVVDVGSLGLLYGC